MKRSLFLLPVALILTMGTAFVHPTTDDLSAGIERGKEVYTTLCASCHMADGTGVAGVFPPLAQSDYLMADKLRSVRIVLHGLDEKITVNGMPYGNIPMPATGLSDQEIADVLTYVRNAWGNEGEAVTVAEVKRERTAK